jgi:hypothetical protein
LFFFSLSFLASLLVAALSLWEADTLHALPPHLSTSLHLIADQLTSLFDPSAAAAASVSASSSAASGGGGSVLGVARPALFSCGAASRLIAKELNARLKG